MSSNSKRIYTEQDLLKLGLHHLKKARRVKQKKKVI